MITSFYGKKLKQSRVFNEAGDSTVVTEIAVEPLTVVALKQGQKDGYTALQVGFDWHTTKKGKKPLIGIIKKTGKGETHLPRFLREIKLESADTELPKVNDSVDVATVFQIGDTIKVTGTSKAKGFQGGVRRHGFAGGPRTHGQGDRERAPGSIGQTTTPGRVYKGKRMAGRMGRDTVTISGLKVVSIDPEKKTMQVKGLIPGNTNSWVLIHK